MKMPGGARGSMGIPAAIHPDTIRAAREERAIKQAEREERAPEVSEAPPPPDDENGEPAEPGAGEAPPADAVAKALDPVEVLKVLGVELTSEDYNRLVFKGYITKDIVISFNPLTQADVKATFKTLTAQEHDEVDELLAGEMKQLDMTTAGRDSRQGTWILAFSMTHIDGMELQKAVMQKNSSTRIDTKETAKRRVRIVRALSPYVIESAANAYNAFSTAIRLISADPKKVFLKKS